jgi:tellurite methyltransferase
MVPEKKKPFWEDSYKRQGKLDTFGGGKPSAAVAKIAPSLQGKAVTALDLGCGEGRNALYLAGLGFKTTAVDISPSGIEKLQTYAKETGLKIEALVCDMREYDFKKNFDLVVCQGCLHLIRRAEWKRVIYKMQASTPLGGIHVVGCFTDTIPEPEDQRGLMVGLFREGELLEQYAGWEVIESGGSSFEHTHPGGIKHSHSANQITARKVV